ncbi:hypothetical protein GFS24_07215 [Chitinophaga sp. SYP-B3965]|uniref:hypothetical protein n=1 Tax=Chitinophaga sp. SYP-B3965 TaxID=2663120 RepID=UPI00129962FC|nr:hypothetical protein [Chitinophaga sp. SYP-B3965]MRG44896.1 hypothetical protein [Chitinophaga sp. SYP-B3965]
MKTLSLKPLFLSALAAISIISCKKSDAPETPQSKDAALITEFFAKNGPAVERFTVDAAAGGVISTAKGTKYKIPAGAFVTASGQPVTGNVLVDVKEITKVSEMLLGNKPSTTANGEILVSYGEFFVKASQNNNQLQLKKDSAVLVQVIAKPAAQIREMPLWDGDSLTTYTSTGYDHENTTVTITQQYSVNRGIQWTQAAGYALFNNTTGTLDFRLDSLLNWRNCDVLYSYPGTKTTVMGYFANNFNEETGAEYGGEQPSMLFFKPKNENSLVKLYNVILNAPAGKKGFHSYQTSIPIGLEGTFLAISAVNGKFYAEMKDVTIAAPLAGKTYTGVTFDPQEVSETALLTLINQLNSK